MTITRDNAGGGRWTPIAAPGSDLAAALAGRTHPELILHVVGELERALALLWEWVRDVQINLALAVQDEGAGGRPPPLPLGAVLGEPSFQAILGDGPTLAALLGKLGEIETAAKRLADNTAARRKVPITELRGFFDGVLELARGLQHLLADTWNRLANIDPLTGLGNRAAMLRRLTIECERHARNQQPCCVAVLDLDRFKAINDTRGHAVGDVVLRSIAALLAASIRPYDEIFRFGGDEFVLCLPNTDLRTAWAIVERLRLRVSQWTVPVKGGEILRTTVSIGVAPLCPDLGVEASLELADEALYRAKQSGRNTLAVAHPPSEAVAPSAAAG